MFAAEEETEAERAERLRKELPWYRGVTCKDIKDIMPTGALTILGPGHGFNLLFLSAVIILITLGQVDKDRHVLLPSPQ